MKLVPVILSGGSGTRLWPLSRELLPKQLLALTGERTMIQETAARLMGASFEGVGDATAPVVVCNEAHRFLVAEQLREMGLPPAAILLEPVGRNTAPAIALAAHAAMQIAGDDALILVLPADHVLQDLAAFQAAIKRALPAASAGKLVTFGIVARTPETGYGYIRRAAGEGPVVPIAQFVEKPDVRRAQEFIASGEYFWNSGMFLFGARRFLEELREHAPDIAAVCERANATAVREKDFTRVDEATFAACRSDSVDYAVMEKTRDAVVTPLDAGWNDVGSWAALHDVMPADEHGNVVRGDVLLEDTDGCYVHAESRLIAGLGLHDMVIVETADAVLVAPRGKVQDVKKLVARIKAAGRAEHLSHATPESKGKKQ
jgi:mannose-1-phosphate guanylyltransferase/mannose-6-phosphate isomerase